MTVTPSKKLLRWSMVDILREFGHEVRADGTLRKKLRAERQFPGSDGKYSTEQVCAAIYSEATRERLRGTKERADNWSLRNAIMRSESLPKAAVIDALSKTFDVIAQLVQSSALTSQEKKDVLAAISAWRGMVATVAQKASRQLSMSTSGDGANGHNGHGEEEEEEED